MLGGVCVSSEGLESKPVEQAEHRVPEPGPRTVVLVPELPGARSEIMPFTSNDRLESLLRKQKLW